MPIWPFRPRQPELQDQGLADLAQMFLLNPDDPTPGSESLNLTRCDFTVESLKVVDDHLEVMRHRSLEGEAMMNLENGAEDSVSVFAQVIIDRAREDA
jgi:hypothetical protein